MQEYSSQKNGHLSSTNWRRQEQSTLWQTTKACGIRYTGFNRSYIHIRFMPAPTSLHRKLKGWSYMENGTLTGQPRQKMTNWPRSQWARTAGYFGCLHIPACERSLPTCKPRCYCSRHCKSDDVFTASSKVHNLRCMVPKLYAIMMPHSAYANVMLTYCPYNVCDHTLTCDVTHSGQLPKPKYTKSLKQRWNKGRLSGDILVDKLVCVLSSDRIWKHGGYL